MFKKVNIGDTVYVYRDPISPKSNEILELKVLFVGEDEFLVKGFNYYDKEFHHYHYDAYNEFKALNDPWFLTFEEALKYPATRIKQHVENYYN